MGRPVRLFIATLLSLLALPRAGHPAPLWEPFIYDGIHQVELPGDPAYRFFSDMTDHTIAWIRQQKAQSNLMNRKSSRFCLPLRRNNRSPSESCEMNVSAVSPLCSRASYVDPVKALSWLGKPISTPNQQPI
jgi:hypothetical protein